jgi:hypothetical protein
VELLHADLVEVREIPKGKDYKPGSVFFFWSVNWPNVLSIVIDRTYHATHNVLVRLNHEIEENAALLHKGEEVSYLPGDSNWQATLEVDTRRGRESRLAEANTRENGRHNSQFGRDSFLVDGSY